MKISDLIISAILKKGIFCDMQEFVSDVVIPDTNIKIHIQAERLSITVMQDDLEET